MSETEDTARFDPEDLERFVQEVLAGVGVDAEHADVVADALVRANLRGVDSHGVARLDAYVRKFEAGGFNPLPNVTVERVAPAALRVDGDGGPGQSVGARAMDAAIDLAGDQGTAVAAVVDSNHFGTAAYFTHRAAERDCIGLAMTNVEPDVVPFGGTEAFLGTNPISFAVPTDRDFPVTLDMATSVVARGKIDHVAAETGASIPDDWAVDEDGRPTTDPEAVHALRPAAGPKGYGLGLIVDVFCGLLTGAGPSPTAGPLYEAPDEPMDLGHFFAAVDVGTFRDVSAFEAALDEWVADLKAVDTHEGVEEVLLPGEIEARTRRERERVGIPLPTGVTETLANLGDRYDVDSPRRVSDPSH